MNTQRLSALHTPLLHKGSLNRSCSVAPIELQSNVGNSVWITRRLSSIRTLVSNAATYARVFYERRQRKGVTLTLAHELMRQANTYGPMMVDQGDADAFISGLTYNYPDVLRPALQAVGAPTRSLCKRCLFDIGAG